MPATATRTRELLRRYVEAWERADLEALVGLLHEDAVMRMPPRPAVEGAAAICAFFSALPGGGDIGQLRVTPSSANRTPALVLRRLHNDELSPHGVLLLDVDGERIAGIDAYIAPHFVALFELPLHRPEPT